MGSMSNPNPWSPYDSYNDCSQGICNIYCPQWCYLVFPPPPPSFFLNNEDDSSSSSSNFSPLLIALIGILVSAFVLVSYYTLISKYCHRRGYESSSETPPRRDRVAMREGISNAATDGDGLNDSLIKSITVYKYRKGDGFVDGSDCSVCLSEFEENESLRLLPKCNHAFHLPCIDTWLKSHSNCPLCRAFVTGTNPTTVPDRIATESSSIQQESGDSAIVTEDLEIGSRNSNARLQSEPQEEQREGKDEVNLPIRRSVSLNSGTVVSIGDVLREIEDEEGDEASGVGTSETKTEANQRSGVSSFLVRNTVAMKRSVSTGRFILSRYDRTRNYRLPN